MLMIVPRRLSILRRESNNKAGKALSVTDMLPRSMRVVSVWRNATR